MTVHDYRQHNNKKMHLKTMYKNVLLEINLHSEKSVKMFLTVKSL